MLVNKIKESRLRKTLREMIDTIPENVLKLTALQMKQNGGYLKLTYEEMLAKISAIGTALIGRGIRKGDRIGLIAENRVEWPIIYLAVTCIGATIVPFDILLKPAELAQIVKAAKLKILFCSESHRIKMEEICSELSGLELGILIDPLPENPSECRVFENTLADFEKEGLKIIAGGQNLFRESKVEPTDTAVLIFTSGTTGNPKGVMLSHAGLMANAAGLDMGTVLGPGDNWIMVLPYHHTYPTILGVILPVYTGATITTIPTLRPNILIQTMQETGATCIPAVPALIEKIYKNIHAKVLERSLPVRLVFRILFAVSALFYHLFGLKIGPALFKSVRASLGVTHLKFFISGAGPIPKEVIDGMEILGLTVMQGYGLTETSPVVSSTFPEHNRSGTVGLPLANVEVKIMHPDSEGNGELLTRGPHIMQGYFEDHGQTEKIIDSEGWLHTGDIARMDKDGYITISGRMKNIIVTKGGKNIYPEELENKLLESEYIAEALVIRELDESGREFPYAVIVPNMEAIEALEIEHKKKYSKEDIEALIDREIKIVNKSLADYKHLRGYEIREDELPKTSSKKVRRFMFEKK